MLTQKETQSCKNPRKKSGRDKRRRENVSSLGIVTIVPHRAAQAELVDSSQHFIDQRLDRMILGAFSNLSDPGVCPALRIP